MFNNILGIAAPPQQYIYLVPKIGGTFAPISNIFVYIFVYAETSKYYLFVFVLIFLGFHNFVTFVFVFFFA